VLVLLGIIVDVAPCAFGDFSSLRFIQQGNISVHADA